ncbi:MAG: phosphoserine phosphatase SerB, partial [Bacteroidaceae bacterium]|nr:phosphoserine phosphatase SerB [Bacteroidaceae bacterium]
MAQELILIRITGEDRPGLTASIMSILAQYDADIMDIGQADIHKTLSLGLLIRVDEQNSGPLMKNVLFKTAELGVNVRFFPVTDDDYNAWVGRQGKNRYILTVLGRRLEARQIEAVTKVIAAQDLNIDSIRRLTGRPPLDENAEDPNATRNKACIEFSLRGTPRDRGEMQRELLKMSSKMAMDCSFQQDNMYRRMRRLICFDMDSTLIQAE